MNQDDLLEEIIKKTTVIFNNTKLYGKPNSLNGTMAYHPIQSLLAVGDNEGVIRM